MNHTIVEMLMTILILVSLLMGGIFIAYQRKGLTFVASFDRAIMWGSGLFAIGSFLSTFVYVA